MGWVGGRWQRRASLAEAVAVVMQSDPQVPSPQLSPPLAAQPMVQTPPQQKSLHLQTTFALLHTLKLKTPYPPMWHPPAKINAAKSINVMMNDACLLNTNIHVCFPF